MPGARPAKLALLVLWFAGVATGGAGLLAYQSEPGGAGTPPAEWPAQSELPRAAGRSTLLLFAHPHCPCTRASFGELEWVTARSPAPVDVVVLSVLPEGAPPGWEGTSGLPGATARVLGARLVVDDCGREAALFGAETSGTVLLFDPAGTLIFRGGITPGRGHAGDNPARQALLSALRGEPAGRVFPVLGCPLSTPVGPDEQ